MKTTMLFLLMMMLQTLICAKNCDEIFPKNASDCQLSSEDKNKGFIYCCYTNLFLGDCTAYDEMTYDIIKDIYKDEPSFVCNDPFRISSAGFINLSIISFIILLILNL